MASTEGALGHRLWRRDCQVRRVRHQCAELAQFEAGGNTWVQRAGEAAKSLQRPARGRRPLAGVG